MKVQEHTTAGQEHIAVLEMVFLMLVVNLDSLKRSVSVGNWFEVHEMEQNNFRLIWIKEWHMEVQVSVSYFCKAMFFFFKMSTV